MTSGGYGYTVGASIAYAYLPAEHAAPGTEVAVEIFGEWVAGEVAPSRSTTRTARASAARRPVGQRAVEDLQAEVDLVRRDRERRRDAQHAAEAGELDDVHVQAELQAARR